MKTFHVTANITGKLTVPDTLVQSLRHEAVTSSHEVPQPYLSQVHMQFPTDDDAFVQAALKNALRQIVRHGIIEDIGGLGVGVKCAPAEVTVSVPERVVTAIKGKEQIGVERLDVKPAPQSLDDLAQMQLDHAQAVADERASAERSFML